jgi:hypothetical protein
MSSPPPALRDVLGIEDSTLMSRPARTSQGSDGFSGINVVSGDRLLADDAGRQDLRHLRRFYKPATAVHPFEDFSD